MAEEELFQERVVRLDRPASHYTMLRAPAGQFLGTADGERLETLQHVDDKAMWQQHSDPDAFRHVHTGLTLTAEPAECGCHLRRDGTAVAADGTAAEVAAAFSPEHGPARLPSEYLKTFRENGWVGLPCILSRETVDALQQASCTGPWSDRTYNPRERPLSLGGVVARTAVEPVSLWLMRQYLRTEDIRLGHSPSFAVLGKDDGKRDVLAWHSDYPYLWGITSRVGGDRIPAHDSGDFAMAVQRNVCITDFTKENGATCFKLGSHRRNSGPPEEWGTGAAYSRPGHRAEHGLPYSGPEADVVEAPAGSVILYDARTWHRTGVNRTDRKRAAMLQAVIPMYIMPFMDTSRDYKAFLASSLPDELTRRERDELRELMVHKMVGPRGQFAIGVDEELTEMMRAEAAPDRPQYP